MSQGSGHRLIGTRAPTHSGVRAPTHSTYHEQRTGGAMDDSSFKAMAEEIEGLLGIDRERHNSFSFATKAVHGYRSLEDGAGVINQPIYQSATFGHPALHQSTGFAYSRCGNPTVLELENTIAMLEGGLKALAFCSGMAAISCIIKLFKSGDVVLVGDDLYPGCLCRSIWRGFPAHRFLRPHRRRRSMRRRGLRVLRRNADEPHDESLGHPSARRYRPRA